MKKATRLLVILVLSLLVIGCSQETHTSEETAVCPTLEISNKEVETRMAVYRKETEPTEVIVEKEKVLQTLIENQNETSGTISLKEDDVVYPYLRSHKKDNTVLTGGDKGKWELVNGYAIFLNKERQLELRRNGWVYEIEPYYVSADYEGSTIGEYVSDSATYVYNSSEKVIEKWILKEKVDTYPASTGCTSISYISSGLKENRILVVDSLDDLYWIDEETKESKKVGEMVIADEIDTFCLSLYYINYYQDVVMVDLRTGDAEIVGAGAYHIHSGDTPSYISKGETYYMPYIDWDGTREEIEK